MDQSVDKELKETREKEDLQDNVEIMVPQVHQDQWDYKENLDCKVIKDQMDQKEFKDTEVHKDLPDHKAQLDQKDLKDHQDLRDPQEQLHTITIPTIHRLVDLIEKKWIRNSDDGLIYFK